VRGSRLAVLIALAGAGCTYVPAGVIEGSPASSGSIVILNRAIPLHVFGLPQCGFEFVRATAAEFEHADAPHLLVRMVLRNDAPRPVASSRIEVRALDGNDRALTTRVEPTSIVVGVREVASASWSMKLAAAAETQTVIVELTHVTYADGTTCPRSLPPVRAEAVSPGPEPPPPPPSPARRDEALAFAQARLNAFGYECGPTDGILGPRTRACIRAFQRREGYPETGEFDGIVWGLLRTGPILPAARAP
jgi:hypothetical protein